MIELTELMNQLISVVKNTGRIMPEAGRREVSEKTSHVDVVTQYDVRIQQELISQITQIDPDAVFLAEEAGKSTCDEVPENKDLFIIDPIDGTTNFVFDRKHSCISVGMMREGRMVLGIVYDPYLDEMYTALKGGGAFCNGIPIHAAQSGLEDSVVDFGTSPYEPVLRDRTMAVIGDVLRNSLDLRRSGSAALDLCDAASGKCGAFFEMKLSPWDFAAGSVLVTEAGGVITDLDGENINFLKPSSVVAGSPKACRRLREILTN